MSMIGSYFRVNRDQLEEMLRNPEFVSKTIFKDVKGANTLEIDKAWHGIHFLLTGDPWGGKPPLKYVVLGWKTLGEEDLGYGPPQYINPEQVKEAAKSLSEVSMDELRKRYNPDRFFEEEIYPEIWDEGEEALNYLLDFFLDIVKFFESAAKNDQAIVFAIT